MFGRVLNSLCFWLLTILAFALFFIAVIRPPVEQYRRHQQVQADMQTAVEGLEKQVAINNRRLADLDPNNPHPLAMDRLAEDTYGMVIPGGRVVPTGRAPPAVVPAPLPDEDPLDESANAGSRWDLIDQFTSREEFQKLGDQQVQRMQLLMAGLAISMAFIFFGTPTVRPGARRPDDGEA